MTAGIIPFTLGIPTSVLDDLHRRLDMTRWPEQETVEGWSQGVPLRKTKALIDHWRHRYDWRRCEQMLNGFGQYRTEIDGLRIHFLHIRSKHENALPLIMTHGWPGSVIEFHKVVAPLTDPTAHGGEENEAFHLILPSLPGYGFSDRPTTSGWGIKRIAAAWAVLMERLGYARYVAQGGDWGSSVTAALGRLAPPGLSGIHLNLPFVVPRGAGSSELNAEEERALAMLKSYYADSAAYAEQQRTRPQTLSYGLTDSPAGQAAWIYEKFYEWTDHDGEPETIITLDEMLDNIMLYWLPSTAASSARLYWESFATGMRAATVRVPVGCSIFPKDIFRAPRTWAELSFPNLVHWNEMERGGHFAAFEQPELFVKELRACFALMR